jgi:hypothetical protein
MIKIQPDGYGGKEGPTDEKKQTNVQGNLRR